PGVESLFTGNIEGVPGQFQMISLIHVLEHIPSPVRFVKQLLAKLEPGGLLLIEVPDCEQNPFMFLIADHSLHCFLLPLEVLAASAGYTLERAANNWVAKELTIVARKKSSPNASQRTADADRIRIQVQNRLGWLQDVAAQARSLASGQRLGVFGTSIA